MLFYFPEISCGVPPPPSLRGGYKFKWLENRGSATYNCQTGYNLQGQHTLICDSTGEWGQPPCCVSECCNHILLVFNHTL